MRALAVFLLIIIGLCWLTLMNGQLFTNALVCLACVVLALLVSLWAARDKRLSDEVRTAWWLVVVLLGLFAVVLAARLEPSLNREAFYRVTSQDPPAPATPDTGTER